MKVFFTLPIDQPKDKPYSLSITSADYQILREMKEKADSFMVTVDLLEIIIWPVLWKNSQILSDLDSFRQQEKERKRKYYDWLIDAKARGIKDNDPLYQEIQRVIEDHFPPPSETDLIAISPQSKDWIERYRAMGMDTELSEYMNVIEKLSPRSLLKKNLQIFLYALDKFCREGNILQPSEGKSTSHEFFKFALEFLNTLGVDIEVLIGNSDDQIFENKAKEDAVKQQRRIKYLRSDLVEIRKKLRT